MGVMRPELVTKSIVPIVMAGVLGIYGLIVAVIITSGISPGAKPYYLYDGFVHLTGGLSAGMCSLASGMAIGIVGDAGVRANAQQPKLYPGMIIILIFAEALALYGLIIGIIISTRAGQSHNCRDCLMNKHNINHPSVEPVHHTQFNIPKDNCHDCLGNKHNINQPSVDPVHKTQVLGFSGQCYKIGENDHDWRFSPALGVDYLCFDSDRDHGLVEYLQHLFDALMPTVLIRATMKNDADNLFDSQS
ncbi:hypothetical protein HU200_065616 [Digitaria exilis]|uniref:V-type proton ATPase proteolipid subunit n=1 Tax=Digitaria exilis TaxID=1010633 RepID=A0A834ZYC1_9POAL|nr:hypothetical protein HU200_065616 [Digitaria exilis]